MENETSTTEKPPIALKQMLVVWFSKIEWREYFTLLIWRIIFIPLLLPLIIVVPLAMIVGILLWFITGTAYEYEIETAIERYVTKIWKKVFP